MTATFLRVVKKHFETTLREQEQPHTLALHLDFLRRTETGPATFKVKDVKLGRQMSIVHVTLSQGNREEVVGYITNANLHREEGVTFDTKWTLQPPRLPVDLSKLENGTDPSWAEKRQWPNASFRKATRQVRTWMPRPGQPLQSIYDEWVCLKDPSERWTNESLGFLADIFPQVCESYLAGLDLSSPSVDLKYTDRELDQMAKTWAPFWYPTVLLNIDIKKALPDEGVKFLFSRLRTKAIKNGRYDLEIIILDPEGDIVALSHHVCMAVSAERNVATRRKVEDGPKI